MNNQTEKGFDRINENRPGLIQKHFENLANRKIKISDSEVKNYFINTFLVMILLIVTLLTLSYKSELTTGILLTTFYYINMFTLGMDEIPYIIQQFNRIIDIQRRLKID